MSWVRPNFLSWALSRSSVVFDPHGVWAGSRFCIMKLHLVSHFPGASRTQGLSTSWRENCLPHRRQGLIGPTSIRQASKCEAVLWTKENSNFIQLAVVIFVALTCSHEIVEWFWNIFRRSATYKIVFVFGRVPLPSAWNYQNIVNWLYSRINSFQKLSLHLRVAVWLTKMPLNPLQLGELSLLVDLPVARCFPLPYLKIVSLSVTWRA